MDNLLLNCMKNYPKLSLQDVPNLKPSKMLCYIEPGTERWQRTFHIHCSKCGHIYSFSITDEKFVSRVDDVWEKIRCWGQDIVTPKCPVCQSEETPERVSVMQNGHFDVHYERYMLFERSRLTMDAIIARLYDYRWIMKEEGLTCDVQEVHRCVISPDGKEDSFMVFPSFGDKDKPTVYKNTMSLKTMMRDAPYGAEIRLCQDEKTIRQTAQNIGMSKTAYQKLRDIIF